MNCIKNYFATSLFNRREVSGVAPWPKNICLPAPAHNGYFLSATVTTDNPVGIEYLLTTFVSALESASNNWFAQEGRATKSDDLFRFGPSDLTIRNSTAIGSK